MSRDGARPMPGPQPPEPDADLPSGASVLAGSYTLALTLGEGDDAVRDEIPVTVGYDSRLSIDPADHQAAYDASMELMN